jgi:hypothetical protein
MYTDKRCGSRKNREKVRDEMNVKLSEILDAWLNEAGTGFANTKLNLHGFKTPTEYVKQYADGVFNVALTSEQVSKIVNEYEKYVRHVENTGEYSFATWRMVDALDEEA